MDGIPDLVLTRSQGQSLRLLGECEAALGHKISTIISPMIKIIPVRATLDLSLYKGLILTSENGVLNAPELGNNRVYCVGKRTKEAAEKAGAKVLWVAKTSAELQARISIEKPAGPLVHLRGRHVIEDMNIPGIETDSVIVYDQIALPVSQELHNAICGDKPAILPLYSPRSALLLGRGVEELGRNLHVVAISDAVARVWHNETGGTCEVCNAPDGVEMVNRIVTALQK